jgi:hypothetical protein
MLIVIASLSLISGFGLTNPAVTFRMTFGLLKRGLSYNLHIVWTPVLLMVFAWLHTFPKLIMESRAIKMCKPQFLEAFILSVGILSFVYFYALSIPFRV